jgi:hypothetical protein
VVGHGHRTRCLGTLASVQAECEQVEILLSEFAVRSLGAEATALDLGELQV